MTEVTVATLNLFNKVGRWGERQQLVVQQLAALQPDVIGLQEVDLIIDQAMAICRLVNSHVGEGPRYRVYHMGRTGRSAHVQALAVMTRLPVVAHEGLDYVLRDGVAQRLRVQLDGGATLDFYNTHLWFPPDGQQDRLAQAKKLLAWSDTWPDAGATVIGGDFNAYPDEPTVALMKERFASAHEAANGSEPESTWPTPVNTFDPSPPGCLDYLFVRGARVVEAGLCFNTPHLIDPDLYPSDHLGVMARLDIDASAG